MAVRSSSAARPIACRFGVAFLCNPDLPARLSRGADLNAAQRATFYCGDARGYTDYPALPEAEIGAFGT
jgi:N-ethylmaleimide reductase